jgi:biotin synthase
VEWVFDYPDCEILSLVDFARKVRESYWGKNFEFCSIINAKSGLCDRGCSFCAQAFPDRTGVKVYPLVDEDVIVESARRARESGVRRFSVVTSGKSVTEREFERITSAIKKIRKEIDVKVDVSLGILPREYIIELKRIGVERIHHNLETSREFYPNVTKKINWNEKFNFCKMVKEEGLELCSGFLFGMGEDRRDWISLADSLSLLEPESIPMNFLIPIKGTPLEKVEPLHPITILKIIVYFRLRFPKSEIRLCGGRERNLGELMVLATFMTNGFLTGGYLTQPGRTPDEDKALVEALGFKLVL